MPACAPPPWPRVIWRAVGKNMQPACLMMLVSRPSMRATAEASEKSLLIYQEIFKTLSWWGCSHSTCWHKMCRVGYFSNASFHGMVCMVTSFWYPLQSCTCLEGSWDFHLVLYYWQRLGLTDEIFTVVMWHAVPRCHFTGANVCVAWFQTGISFWAVLLTALCSSTSVCDMSPPSKTYSLLSTGVKPVGFLLLGNLNMVLCHYAPVEYSCGCCWGLRHLQMSEAWAKPMFLECLLWFMSAKAVM